MKLSKTKKILLSGTTLVVLTTSIVTPIVFLNKDEKDEKDDVEKIFKILQAKTTQEKIIELSSNASGKIIADNQDKIIAKIKNLIGKANLKEVKIEVLMEDDTNISTTPQKIIIKLTKDEVFKEIKDFSVKKKNPIDEDIESIKKILDTKTSDDLIIMLPSSSNGNIIGNATNKNEIIKKLRILIDSSNNNGESNHASLKGTTIEVSMNNDALISTTSQNIIVSISKTGRKTLKTSKTFQVKKESTADEDISAIKNILDAKVGNDLIIMLPSNSSGNIISKATNKNEIIKKLRILIDSSNANGEANHASLKGTSIEVSIGANAPISTAPQNIIVFISKANGTTLRTSKTFQVKRDFTADEDIAAIKKILDSKTGNDLIIDIPTRSWSNINNPTNENIVKRKIRMLIDPLNTSGNHNHASLRGTTITLTKIFPVNFSHKGILITISKTGGTSLQVFDFLVRKT